MYDRVITYLYEQHNGIFSSIIVLLGAVAVYWLVKRSLKLLMKSRNLAPPLIAMLTGMVKWVIFTVTILLVFQQFGILPNVWAAFLAVLAAIAVGLVAGWSVLSNVLCTFLILVFRPFRVSDTIRIPSEDLQGKVIDLNFMHTSIKDSEGHIARIPNNLFFLKPIVCQEGTQDISLFEQLNADQPHNK